MALPRLSELPDGRAAYYMRRPLPDGHTHLVPTGIPVPIAAATLLEPQDVALAGDSLVMVSDGAVWLARP